MKARRPRKVVTQQHETLTKEFENQPLQLVPHNGDLWVTMDDIGKALDYSEPLKGIQNVYGRNKEELNNYSCTLKLRVQGSNGPQNREVRVFNEEGVMVLTMLSRQPKAAAFRRWAVKVLKSYRTGQLTLTQSVPLEHDKFLERMVIEAGKGNHHAIYTLENKYGYPKQVKEFICCYHCNQRVDIAKAKELDS